MNNEKVVKLVFGVMLTTFFLALTDILIKDNSTYYDMTIVGKIGFIIFVICFAYLFIIGFVIPMGYRLYLEIKKLTSGD